MKTSFVELIVRGWKGCLVFLRKPAWAIVLSCIFAASGLVFFGFVGSVSGTRFDFSTQPIFMFLMKFVFEIWTYGVVEGLLAEGPFLLIMLISTFVFLVFRMTMAGLEGKVENATVKIAEEFITTGLFLAILLVIFFPLSAAFNVSLGNAFFRTVLFTLFLVPVFRAGMILLARGLKNRFALMGTAIGIVLVLAFLEAVSYFPQASGIWAAFRLIHSVLSWISPLSYWFSGSMADSFIGVILQLLPLVILGTAFLAGALFRVKRNEVQS